MKISVIIPTYQHGWALPFVLNSIFSQTRQPDEVIVVDDGSTDDTAAVVQAHPSVIYIKQENRGAPAARNAGFAKATGDAMLFWDADVIGEPDMIARLESTLNVYEDASWSYSSFVWGSKKFVSKEYDPEALRELNYIHTTSLIRREAFPGFDESLKKFQDWDLWLTMSNQGMYGVFVDDVLFTVLVDRSRDMAYSRWLPSFVYSLPWPILGWTPKAIRQYNEAREIVRTKHGL